MTRLNIVIVCGAGIVSGKETVSVLLAREFRRARWNPEFITSSWSDGAFVRLLVKNNFAYHRLRLGFVSASLRFRPLVMTLDQLRYWPALVYGYMRILRATRPQAVIHTNWQHALLLLPLLKQRRDVFWAHELYPNTLQYAYVFRAIAKRVGRVVCVSHACARSLLTLGVPKSKLTVVHNGFSTEEPGPVLIDQPVLRLGIVGQIGRWKGHEDLLEAIAILARGGTDVLLRIFGAGHSSFVRALEAKVEELNLNDKVQWYGTVNNQSDIYRDIDVCVQPSRYEEPFGMSALEAHAFGRPVIGSACGGLPEIIDHGVTGFLVEPRRPDQLAQAIKLLAQNFNLVRTMGEAARKRAIAEFSSGSFVQKFITTIEETTGIAGQGSTTRIDVDNRDYAVTKTCRDE